MPRSGHAGRIAETLAFPLVCYGVSAMLAIIEFVIDAAYQPPGANVGALWQRYSAGMGAFALMVVGMWVVFAAVALGLRRLRGLVQRDRIVACALAGVLAYLGLAGLANLESRMKSFPSMSDTTLLLITLAIPTVLSAVLAPAIVAALASRRKQQL